MSILSFPVACCRRCCKGLICYCYNDQEERIGRTWTVKEDKEKEEIDCQILRQMGGQVRPILVFFHVVVDAYINFIPYKALMIHTCRLDLNFSNPYNFDTPNISKIPKCILFSLENIDPSFIVACCSCQ